MSRATLFSFIVLVLGGCGMTTITNPSVDADVTWADATGRAVDVFGAPNAPPMYRDSQGFFWQIDPDTLTVGYSVIEDGPFYATSDCVGTPLLSGVPVPRVTFALNSGGATSPTIHVRDDVTEFSTSEICGMVTAAGMCGPPTQEGCSMESVVPESSTLPAIPLTIPVVDFVAPLHPVSP